MRGDVRAAWEVAHLRMKVDPAWADERPACICHRLTHASTSACLPLMLVGWTLHPPGGSLAGCCALWGSHRLDACTLLTWYWP